MLALAGQVELHCRVLSICSICAPPVESLTKDEPCLMPAHPLIAFSCLVTWEPTARNLQGYLAQAVRISLEAPFLHLSDKQVLWFAYLIFSFFLFFPCFFFFVFVVLGIEPRTFLILVKRFTTELHLQPLIKFFFLGFIFESE